MYFFPSFSYLALIKIFKPFNLLVGQLDQRSTFNIREKFPLLRPSSYSPTLICTSSSLQIIATQFNNLFDFFLRLNQIFILFAPIGLFGIPLNYLGILSQDSLFHWIKWSLSRAGATFTKLGQWAATRPDILPLSLCSILASLHSNAPTHSMAWNRKVILESFGLPIDEIFLSFDPIPVGSGTVAQVHHATLVHSDQSFPVAIKIVHPNISTLINCDLFLLKFFARLLDQVFPSMHWISIPDEVDFFSEIMKRQLDLRFEGFALHRFGKNFEATAKAWGDRRKVLFASPVYPFVAKNVLVQTFIDGIAVSSLYPIKSAACPQQAQNHCQLVRDQIARIGLQSLLQMVLWDNFVHADLHPGNILVTFTPAERRKTRFENLFLAVVALLERTVSPKPIPKQPLFQFHQESTESRELFIERMCQGVTDGEATVQLVFLDTGLVTELGRRDLQNFSDLFISLVLTGDGYNVGKLMIERSPLWAQDQIVDREAFCREMRDIIHPFFGNALKSTTLTDLSLGPTFERVFGLVQRYRVRIDPSFTNLVMSLLCIEGLGRRMSPEMDLRLILAQAALQYLITSVVKISL